jgi:hypothetical protein
MFESVLSQAQTPSMTPLTPDNADLADMDIANLRT